MIETEHQYQITLSRKVAFEHALSDLRQKKALYHPSWFMVFEDGILTTIQELEQEMQAYQQTQKER